MLRLDNRNKKLIGKVSEPIDKQLIFSYVPDDKEYYAIINGKPFSLKKKDSHLIWDIPDNINKNDIKLKIQCLDPKKRNTLYTTPDITLNTISTTESANNGFGIMAFTTTSTIIYDSNYPFYNMVDEHPVIPIIEKDIKMPINYKMAVSREKNSQILTFETNRYFDGVDRSKKICWIRYVNAKNHAGEAAATNVFVNENKLIFGWLLDGNVTICSGKVEFIIEFSGENEKNEPYLWKSLPAVLMIEKGLWIDDEASIIEKYPSTIEKLQIKTKSLEEFISNIDVGFNKFD